MRVYHFNTNTRGGAAMATRRLHDTLYSIGVDSKFLHSGKEHIENDDSYQIFPEDNSEKKFAYRLRQRLMLRRYRRHLNKFLPPKNLTSSYIFSYAKLPFETPISNIDHKVDVIHLHWIRNFIDYPSFFSSIPDFFPIVWTLHDMNPFTGGCHYTWGCEKYKSECLYCPQLSGESKGDLSRENFYIKFESIKNKNIHIVADSYWLEKKARQSKILSNSKSFRTIHYGIDLDSYFPKDKKACKNALSIPENVFVLSFGAVSVSDPRKGFTELIKALNVIKQKNNIIVLVFGSMEKNKNLDLPQIKYLGYLDSPMIQSIVYSASDIFVMTSLQEAFGQTVLEAMACGTPVVGFASGGIPDMIKPMENGLLANVGNTEDLSSKIQWMIDHPYERIQMGNKARKTAEKEFSLQVQAKKYIDLYECILNYK